MKEINDDKNLNENKWSKDETDVTNRNHFKMSETTQSNLKDT